MTGLTNSQNQRSFLGTGWSFPLRLNLQGNLQLSSAEQNIEESIWIILKTAVGERASRPDFGSTLSELAFAPLNSDTLVMACIAVEDALSQWEPRIALNDVRADPDPIQGLINIVIDYQILETYESRSLVYPFYLQSAEPDLDSIEKQEQQGARGEKTLDNWYNN